MTALERQEGPRRSFSSDERGVQANPLAADRSVR